MSAADLRMLIEHASDWAEKQFGRKGRLWPMWHAVKANGDHIVMEAPPGSKDESAAMVRAFFELNDVVRCLFIDEAWIAVGGEELRRWVEENNQQIATYPGRVEVVAFMGEDDVDGMLTAHRKIIRGEGKPKLGPLTVNERWDNAQGRLVGMLPRRAARVQ